MLRHGGDICRELRSSVHPTGLAKAPPAVARESKLMPEQQTRFVAINDHTGIQSAAMSIIAVPPRFRRAIDIGFIVMVLVGLIVAIVHDFKG